MILVALRATYQGTGTKPVLLGRPVTFPKQTTSISRPHHSAFRFFARLAACLLAVTLGIVATTNNTAACGMPTSLPSSPFMNSSGDFRFSYWESLAQIKVSPKIILEIPLGFTPIPNYQRSIFFGDGLAFPLLESTLLPKSENEFEMIFPSGHRETLKRTKTANQLKGSNWLGTINGREVTVKSSCSWTLVYSGGRLKTLKTPDGVTMEFKNDKQGNHWILANGKSVLTLKPAYDADTQKIYHLNIQGGKHAVLRLGARPVLVKTFEKDSFGRNKEKKQDTQALTSIQWDGEPEKHYVFDTNAVNAGGHPFKWDMDLFNLIEKDSERYSIITINGIKCFKTIFPNGESCIRGKSRSGNTVITQEGMNPIVISEYFTRGSLRGKEKKISNLMSNGTVIILRQFWYNETGEVFRKFIHDKDGGCIYERKDGKLLARRANDKKNLWIKKYNLKGQLVEFRHEQKSFYFNYLSENKVKMTFSNGDETLERTFTFSDISHLTQNPFLLPLR